MAEQAEPIVEVESAIWIETWRLLKEMGDGRFESACVWGGVNEGGRLRAKKIYPIGPEHGVRRGSLFHRMTLDGASRLFADLRADGLRIVADVHTHPAEWVGLSDVDREHPIEFRRGLICLVLPGYAVGNPSVELTGVHVYRGDGQWADRLETGVEHLEVV